MIDLITISFRHVNLCFEYLTVLMLYIFIHMSYLFGLNMSVSWYIMAKLMFFWYQNCLEMKFAPIWGNHVMDASMFLGHGFALLLIFHDFKITCWQNMFLLILHWVKIKFVAPSALGLPDVPIYSCLSGAKK